MIEFSFKPLIDSSLLILLTDLCTICWCCRWFQEQRRTAQKLTTHCVDYEADKKLDKTDKTDNKTGKTDNKANKTEKLDHKTVSVLTLFLNEEKQTELKSQQRHVLTLFLHSVIHERRRKLARVVSLPWAKSLVGIWVGLPGVILFTELDMIKPSGHGRQVKKIANQSCYGSI